MFAVVAAEAFINDAAALFNDEAQAEEYAAKLSNDPDFHGCEYAVVVVTIDDSAIRAVS